ncbi:hypothetical protein M9H77_05673 [Catharanthus roseus]|uniref:Uncharacterized protein n=1 Tax=Catharanthus roseus TaxID=4058 RepID=A0ACC0CHQ4_CATRO|nr:hypothetical protein M9H77_05673 [Catharanthus roseus]
MIGSSYAWTSQVCFTGEKLTEVKFTSFQSNRSILGFTGIDDPYEPPLKSEIVLHQKLGLEPTEPPPDSAIGSDGFLCTPDPGLQSAGPLSHHDLHPLLGRRAI